MRHTYLGAAIAVLVLAIGGGLARGQDDKDTAPTNDNTLSPTVKLELEVDALTTLNDLNLSATQLSALKDTASDTAGSLSETPTPISDDYKAALKGLKTALVGGNDDKIETAEDSVGDLADKQDDDSEPDIEQSQSAKEKAAALVKSLSVKQLAQYLSANADEIDDPTQVVTDAIHQSRGMSDDDFSDLVDDTTQDLTIFLAGPNPTKTPAVIGKVKSLLTRAHRMKDDEYSDQQSALEADARKLVGGVDPVNCMRHWMENEMADLLANPELSQAIDDWTAAGKG